MNQYLRPSLSTILVVLFFFILIFLALFAEIFESQGPEVDIAQIYANPIPINEIQYLKTLKITNKNGSFKLENTHSNGNLIGPWQMIEPQTLKIKDEVITKIIEALNIVRVRNFHRLEPINITSFSLDNPTLVLNFTNLKNKDYEIKMGLINPIDNSAYLSLSSQDQIYQIDPIEMTLESYDLTQLVESRIFAINKDSLQSLEFYGKDGLRLKMIKKEDIWNDQNGVVLSSQKINTLFDRLEGIKSFSILENLNSEQIDFFKNILASPSIIFKIISKQGLRTYLINQVNGKIPGMSIPRNDLFVLSSDEKNSFILVEKSEISAFLTKPQELK